MPMTALASGARLNFQRLTCLAPVVILVFSLADSKLAVSQVSRHPNTGNSRQSGIDSVVSHSTSEYLSIIEGFAISRAPGFLKLRHRDTLLRTAHNTTEVQDSGCNSHDRPIQRKSMQSHIAFISRDRARLRHLHGRRVLENDEAEVILPLAGAADPQISG